MEEKERKRERHRCERDTSIGCFLRAPWPGLGIKPATQVHALDWGSNPRPLRAEGGEYKGTAL